MHKLTNKGKLFEKKDKLGDRHNIRQTKTNQHREQAMLKKLGDKHKLTNEFQNLIY